MEKNVEREKVSVVCGSIIKCYRVNDLCAPGPKYLERTFCRSINNTYKTLDKKTLNMLCVSNRVYVLYEKLKF